MTRRNLSRRDLLRSALILPIAGCARLRGYARRTSMPTDIRIEDVSYSYEEFRYRAPYKFGGRAVDRVTLLNFTCAVRTMNGRAAKGFGSMPLGNVWSFPSDVMSYDTTLNAMKALAARIAKITSAYPEAGHPLDINRALEPAYLQAAAEVTKTLGLAEPIPKLCTLVTASPFDAAIHDAYGKVHGLNCYSTYGPEFLGHDLSLDLGPDFRGEYLNHYIPKDPKPRLAVFHSVGALDPLEASDLTRRLDDGLPETLPEWIRYNGLTHFKIKLNGNDLDWDVERVLRIDRIVTEDLQKRGVAQWAYSLDFNEKCPNVGYVLDFLHRVKERTPRGFDRIQYLEQPTARDLKAHRANTMHEAAKLRPVVIDESLTDLESLLLAREMGYTGVALKACKGQSQAMLMAAAAQKYKMFRCVQDLTCPGASLIHSAGLAAHVPGVTALEANAREFVPAANRPWENKFPGIFHITDGTMDTSGLTGPGLSAVPPAS
jgi:L-alanine-DL-glutamate epimerase-like enolase superfamily enzyme